MSINRVKAAVQRLTHLTDKQMCQEYPEFMSFWRQIKREEEDRVEEAYLLTRTREILDR